MFATTQTGDSNPTRHLVFAALYYLIGVILVLARVRQGEIRWKAGGKASLASLVALGLASISWGTLSLASGLGHGAPDRIDITLRFGTLGLVFLSALYDRYFHSRW